MFVRVESTHDESTWQAMSARTRLKERDRVRRGGKNALPHNSGMHPTRNSAALIITGSSGRVMPGVMSPLRVESKKSPAAPQLNAD